MSPDYDPNLGIPNFPEDFPSLEGRQLIDLKQGYKSRIDIHVLDPHYSTIRSAISFGIEQYRLTQDALDAVTQEYIKETPLNGLFDGYVESAIFIGHRAANTRK